MRTATRNRLPWVAALLTLLLALPAFAQDATKLEGIITGISGDTVTIKDNANAEQTFDLGADTQYKMTKGLTGVIHESAERGALMAGLRIKADVVAGVATEVSFKAEDFRTAQQIAGGVAPTERRMNDFGTYEALETVEIHFASGSATVSAEDQAALRAFADKAKATDGYMVVLQGFTDSTGNAEANQRLSRRRAEAVSNFLQQTGGLQPGRVTSPDGMGVSPDAGSGDNAGARKVVVKLVVDKGQAGGQ